MRQTLVLIAVLVWTVAPGAAAPACAPGTLASYIALGSGGCTAGQVTFANFAYTAKSSGGAPQISAEQIQVTPMIQIPATGGFTFSAKWSVTSGETQESIIKYTVTGPPTSSGSLMLQLGTAHIGVGSAAVYESTSSGNLQVYDSCHTTCRSLPMAQLPFTPSSPVLSVTDHVKLSGTASLSSYTALFDYCPLCV